MNGQHRRNRRRGLGGALGNRAAAGDDEEDEDEEWMWRRWMQRLRQDWANLHQATSRHCQQFRRNHPVFLRIENRHSTRTARVLVTFPTDHMVNNNSSNHLIEARSNLHVDVAPGEHRLVPISRGHHGVALVTVLYQQTNDADTDVFHMANFREVIHVTNTAYVIEESDLEFGELEPPSIIQQQQD